MVNEAVLVVGWGTGRNHQMATAARSKPAIPASAHANPYFRLLDIRPACRNALGRYGSHAHPLRIGEIIPPKGDPVLRPARRPCDGEEIPPSVQVLALRFRLMKQEGTFDGVKLVASACRFREAK